MKARGPVVVAVLLATLGGVLACQSIGPPCPTLAISPGVPFLESEVGRALHSLRAARGALPGDGSGAREALDEAEAALLRLQTYYVPLLESRQRASNAFRLASRGELREAEGELGHIETTLLTLARSGGQEMGREVAEPLDLLAEARVALEMSSPEAPAGLEDLTERLELMLLKGDLVLP